MNWQNYGHQPFDKKTVIWRYMDTSRFLSLVTESTLYFPMTCQLNDPFVGLENENGELLGTFFRQLCGRIGKMPIEEAACGVPAYLSTERRLARVKAIAEMHARDRAKMARIIPKRFDLLQRLIRCTALVSCWHINDYQSAAMWGLYCKSGEGIAIKSTAGAWRHPLAKLVRK